MWSLKLAALVGLAITATNARTESCGSVSTVFVTVAASEVTTTITVALDAVPSEANIEIAKVLDVVPTPVQAKDIVTHITTTITDYVMFTQVLNGVEANPKTAIITPTPTQIRLKPVETSQGPYYFTAHSGTTFWIGGKTPPAGNSYSTSTTMITVLPIPLSSPVLSEDSTTYSTLTLTRVSLVLNTVQIVKSIPEDIFTSTSLELTTISTASAKPFNLLGSTGWNTSTASLGVKAVESGAILLKAHRHQSGAQENSTPSVEFSFPASTQSSLVPNILGSGNITKPLAARQIGATVFATIEGKLVSWVNNFAGVDPLTSIAHTSSVSISEDVLPPSSTKAAKVPIYPWDLPSISLSNSAEKATSIPLSGALPLGSSFAQLDVSSQQYSNPTSLENKQESTFSTVPKAHSTRFVTSIISLEPAHPTSLHATSVSSKGSSVSIPKASKTTSSCDGEVSTEAGFTVDFDDLPHFVAGPNNTDIPPIFNPYRKLFFEDHYGYVPPPSDPFLPHSPPQLAVYRANAGQNVDRSPDAGLESVGEFGAGPRGSSNAFWIDAYSMWLGCANEGPSDCIVTINGYDFTHSTRVVFQTVILPPCPGLLNCELTFIQFAEAFRKLSGIQILAAVDQTFTVYYLDDLKLAWSNNTCAAQVERSSVR